MQKKYLKISILLICGVVVFGGCQKKVVKQTPFVNEPEVDENMPTEAPPEPAELESNKKATIIKKSKSDIAKENALYEKLGKIEQACNSTRLETPKSQNINSYIEDGIVYLEKDNEKIIVAKNIDEDEQNPTKIKSYINTALSKDLKHIAMEARGWESVIIEIYDIENKEIYTTNYSGNGYCWLDDGRLKVVGICGMGIDCGVYESVDNGKPWILIEKEIDDIENDNVDIKETEIITSDIDTSNWLTYKNENYGFDIKYPKEWNWKDKTNDYKHLHIDFILENPNNVNNYLKSFSVSALDNKGYTDIVDYYENETDSKFTEFKETDKRKLIITNNGYKAIFEYDEPAFVSTDAIKILCNDYVIFIDSVSGKARRELEVIINEFNCFK